MTNDKTVEIHKLTKKCNKCCLIKDVAEFYRDRTHSDGRRTNCKDCEGRKRYSELRCIGCQEWFTKRSYWQRFCTERCHYLYKGKIRSRSSRIYDSQLRYRQRNRELLSAKAREWYWRNREHALQQSMERKLRKKMRIINSIMNVEQPSSVSNV